MKLVRLATVALAYSLGLNQGSTLNAQSPNSMQGLKRSIDNKIAAMQKQEDNLHVKFKLEKLVPGSYKQEGVLKEGWLGRKYSSDELARIRCGETVKMKTANITFCYSDLQSGAFITHLQSYHAKSEIPEYDITIHDTNKDSAGKGDFTRVKTTPELQQRSYTLSYINDVMHNWDVEVCSSPSLLRTEPYSAASFVSTKPVKTLINGAITFFTFNQMNNIDERIREKYQQLLGTFGTDLVNKRVDELRRLANDKINMTPEFPSNHSCIN